MIEPLALLAAYGICFGLQNKLPFLYRRHPFLDALLKCSYCTGFHCGWLVWLLTWGVTGQMPAQGWFIPGSLILWAFASAVTCYLLDTVASWLEEAR